MKTLLIINSIVALITLILAFELTERVKTMFRKDYPNAKLNKISPFTRFISLIATIVKACIPIYNILCVMGFLFLTDKMLEQGYDILVDRIVEE